MADTIAEAQKTARTYWQNCSELNAPDWLYEIQAHEIATVFVPGLKPEDSVLDIGCGDGRFSLQIGRRCGRVDAFDLSANLIEKARQAAREEGIENVRFEMSDAGDIEPEREYDHVVCTGLFTAIPDDVQFRRIASSAARRIKPGGCFLLKDSLVSGDSRVVVEDGYAAIYRNEKEYIGVFESLGLELEEKRVLGLLPCGQYSKLLLFRKPSSARKSKRNASPKPSMPSRRVACYAGMPFHSRALKPIADGFEESLLSGDMAEIMSWRPDVIVVADAPPIPELREYCDTRNALLIGLQHGAANRYMAPEREYSLADYFCGSDWDIRRFTGKGVTPRKGALRTGNPWVDEIFTIPKRALHQDNPTMLFAPTYNPEISAAGFFQDRLVEMIRSVYPKSRIVIKPHPAILQYDHPYVAQYRTLFENWVESWRKMAREIPDVQFVDDCEAPISRFFPDADILISDASSLIFEFMALDRPILLYASTENIAMWEKDPEAPGNAWRDIGAEFSTEEEFVAALSDAFTTHKAAHSAIQKKRSQELYGEFQDGKSHQRVVEAIRNLPYLEVLVMREGSSGVEDFAADLGGRIANCRIDIVDRSGNRGAALNRHFKGSSAEHILVIDYKPGRTIECADFIASAIRAASGDDGIAAAGRIRTADSSEYVETDWCIFDREKLLEVGGFSESLSGVEADVELSARIVSRGYGIHSAWDDQPVIRFGRGFHPEDNGVRWMSNEGTLVVGRSVLDEETCPPIKVRFDLTCAAPAYYSRFPFSVKVFEGDEPKAEARFEQPHQTVTVELPASKSLQTIRLVSEESYVPREMGINGDPRRLSVILRNLQVTEVRESDRKQEMPARLIAFYLPQFHSIPENDRWWGKGFTDWANVKQAKPLFDGHYQPHVPSELGYYDLMSPDVRNAQADLARGHGIEGFCCWHYWFNGKRLLEGPFDAVLELGEPDFPFCLAWANENWTRNWDGHANHILKAQEYGGESDDAAHFEWLVRAFTDRRYIKVDGKPLFLIYRPADMPDVSETISLWRRLAESAGLPGLHLVAIKISDDRYPEGYWTTQGFDAELVFQPSFGPLWDAYGAGKIEGAVSEADEGQEPGLTLSYGDAWPLMANGGDSLRTVVPCWDNTPRRKSGAFILKDSSPDLYEEWLRTEIERTSERAPDHRLVFINAWNEWGEGNHLEPDERFGRGYLVATKRAMLSTAVAQLHAQGRIEDAASELEEYLAGDPEYAQGHNDLGVLHCETGDLERARLHLGKALSLAEENDTFVRNLADLYLALGETDDALKLYRKVLEGNPDDKEILNRVDRLAARAAALEHDASPAPVSADSAKLRIIAILAVFNEGDIISHVVRDLVEQDIEVYILDHHSTDNSVEEASKWLGKGLIKIETFPDESGLNIPNDVFALRYILLRKEQLVRELGPAWYINADTDEFRESPWPGLNLREGIERVDAQGYNTINFAILDFKPTDNSFVPGDDVRKHLTHYSESKVAWDNIQARCWKHWGQQFQLWQTGGHLVEFEGRRIYPIPFILRHYPIRSQQHGELKIFNERKNRFDQNERAAKWHVQYDDIVKEEHQFLHDKKDLAEYDRTAVCRHILRRYGGIEIGEDAGAQIESEGKTSIVILAHNQVEYTRKCLDSILRCTNSPYEIVIVDNGSTDGTDEYLSEFKAEWETKPGDFCKAVKLVRHDLNLGYAGGNNSGIAVSEGAYVCLMNNDIVVTPGWLDRLTRFAEWDPRIGIVGPVSNHVSGQQLAEKVSYNQDTLHKLEEFAADWARTCDQPYEEALRLVGFCMLIKRVVIEQIGGLDTRFGLGNYEDDDFCIRAGMAGFRSFIVRDCFVHHFGSRTFKGERINYEGLLAQNWELFKQKWGLAENLPLRAPYEIGALLLRKFDPALHYVPVSEEESGEMLQVGGTWFVAPDWDESAAWQQVLEEYVRSNRPGDGALLRLYAGHLTSSTTDEAYARVSAFLKRCGAAEDECPDIEITGDLPSDPETRIILAGSALDDKLRRQFPGRCVRLNQWRKAA